MSPHRPPKTLGAAGRKWWRDVCDQFEPEAHQMPLMLVAARQIDRLEYLHGVLLRDGEVIEDRYGKPKAHPASSLARDAAATLRGAIRELRFDAPVGDL